MKAIMIIYNQAHSERIDYLMEKNGIQGYSLWENVKGRGTTTGVPHLSSHAWPEINKSLLMAVDDDKVDPVLEGVKKIDSINKDVGIRAFVWDIIQTV